MSLPTFLPTAARSGPALFTLPDTAGTLLAALREGGNADALMREATQALLHWQQQAGPAPAQPFFDELQGFASSCAEREFGRQWSEAQQGWWAHSVKVLAGNFAAQPQIALHGDFTPRHLRRDGIAATATAAAAPFATGPLSYDLASLLRDPFQAWEEEQELDWAIRYWEQARKAGLPIDGDFGLFWQQLEWTGLHRHLSLLGELSRRKHESGTAFDDEAKARLLALAIKVTTRYVQLSPLTHLLQDLQGSLVQTGFTLR